MKEHEKTLRTEATMKIPHTVRITAVCTNVHTMAHNGHKSKAKIFDVKATGLQVVKHLPQGQHNQRLSFGGSQVVEASGLQVVKHLASVAPSLHFMHPFSFGNRSCVKIFGLGSNL